MISADTLRLLMEVGVTGEALLRVTESIEKDNAKIVTPVTPNALRQARFRARQRVAKALRNNVTRNVTDVTDLPPDKEKSPGPPKEINPPHTHTQRAREDTPEFMEFWHAYPNKVGKPTARLKFQKALEKAVLAEILAGLQRYIRDKPTEREWCNPATWLHQERWNDLPLYTNGKATNGQRPISSNTAVIRALDKLQADLRNKTPDRSDPTTIETSFSRRNH